MYNLSIYKQRRRNLRKRMTPAEGILWSHIRNRYLGYKFKRQFGIGKYIIDFYSPELKLAIEIDGGDHYEKNRIIKDKERTKYLNDIGIVVKRYTNLEIKSNLNSVLEELKIFCDGLK